MYAFDTSLNTQRTLLSLSSSGGRTSPLLVEYSYPIQPSPSSNRASTSASCSTNNTQPPPSKSEEIVFRFGRTGFGCSLALLRSSVAVLPSQWPPIVARRSPTQRTTTTSAPTPDDNMHAPQFSPRDASPSNRRRIGVSPREIDNSTSGSLPRRHLHPNALTHSLTHSLSRPLGRFLAHATHSFTL